LRACQSRASDTTGTLNATYNYDANGNLLSGNGASLSWTAANLPASINAASGTDNFSYGPERQRIAHTTLGGLGKTIYYAGAMEDELAGSNSTIRTYLPYAIGFIVDDGSAVKVVRYYHKDHLGSVIAITDDSGAVLERYAYDTWGKRRKLDGSDDTANTLSASVDRYGYTAQEELDTTRFIHMGGRVYNPLLARFVSADPVVSDARDWQALNRYSYVLGNPLAYTDPTGYEATGLAAYSGSFRGFVNTSAPPTTVIDVQEMRCPISMTCLAWVGGISSFAYSTINTRFLVELSTRALLRSIEIGAVAAAARCIASAGCVVVVGGVAAAGYAGYKWYTMQSSTKPDDNATSTPESSLSSSSGGADSAAGSPPPDGGDNNGNKNTNKSKDDQVASEKTSNDIHRRVERDLGKDARRELHDAKQSGSGDRTLGELKQDARDLYIQAGKEIPSWLKRGIGARHDD
jgi:RHS repeat-associated protein